MAIEVLFRLKDGPSGRRAGDIVAVKELPHRGWGKEEGPPNYAVVRISDVDKKNFEQYHKRHYTEIIGDSVYGARSKFKLNIDALSVEDKTALTETGLYEDRLSAVTDKLEANTLSVVSPASISRDG